MTIFLKKKPVKMPSDPNFIVDFFANSEAIGVFKMSRIHCTLI